jgi:hypothetical protein
VTQTESLRHGESRGGVKRARSDSPCFMVRRDDSSRSVTEMCVECMQLVPCVQSTASLGGVTLAPTTSGDALRLAIGLAVDGGEYERAAAQLDVLRRTP